MDCGQLGGRLSRRPQIQARGPLRRLPRASPQHGPIRDTTVTQKESTTSDTAPFGAMGPESVQRDKASQNGGKSKGARRRKPASKDSSGDEGSGSGNQGEGKGGGGSQGKQGGQGQRRRKKPGGRGQRGQGQKGQGQKGQGQQGQGRRQKQKRQQGQRKQGQQGRRVEAQGEGSGMFCLDNGVIGVLRQEEAQFTPSKRDIYVPKNLIQRHRLREGAMVKGPIGRGQKHKWQLLDVTEMDGKEPKAWAATGDFRSLVTIDPDFHYAVGDVTDNVSMRVLDLIAPVGRGQRTLIVAPPRSGKTILMREFAKGIEQAYPEVHLMVLLVDERPEEATEWVRSTKGQVFVSTSDQTAKNHIQLAEAVWRRCQRLVEMGEDVVLLLDSITRLARAYNNMAGSSGRTMSGGLDSRAMERPRQIFGAARNTETAGSLTILGSCLVETGSSMDSMIFEEFKGTGNSEIVLSRKLADRRIFPAIDIERSGTRKEEKLFSNQRHRWISTLRRVLLRMNFIEAIELLITRLDDVEQTDDFLKRFEVDPEA